jgi:alpha-glucan,water dikinase
VSRIGGEEEIPDNVQGILVLAPEHDYPDVLAHVSVRARNLKVLLAVCFNVSKCKDLESHIG